MDSTEHLLKELTEAHGVPGYETPIRAVVRKYMKPLGELSQDKIGSVICKQKGKSDQPRVMLAGHMDEIGFMVRQITQEGFIKFLPLGGWFDQVLLGQRVLIKTVQGDVTGVIGAKPPHLLSAEDRSKVVVRKDMYIDIGATADSDVREAGVRVGDPVVPKADFEILATGKAYLSKAFDDRIGVALMISVLQILKERPHPNTVYAAATVMEEVGLRGARVAAWAEKPDAAVVLECTGANEVPTARDTSPSTRLGMGPAITLRDTSFIADPRLVELFRTAAREKSIPHQYKQPNIGGTDAGSIHRVRDGVPSLTVAVPARYIHSPCAILDLGDFENTATLAREALQRLPRAFAP